MSAYYPPTYYSPLFDADAFESNANNAYIDSYINAYIDSNIKSKVLQYPVAQGTEIFNEGILASQYKLQIGGYLGQMVTIPLTTRSFNTNTDFNTFFPVFSFPNEGTFLVLTRYNLKLTSGAPVSNGYSFNLQNTSGSVIYTGSGSPQLQNGGGAVGGTIFFSFPWILHAQTNYVIVPCLQLGYTGSNSATYDGYGEITLVQLA